MSADYWAERARILAAKAEPIAEPKAPKRAPKAEVEPQPAVETPADSGLNPKE
jgi:hypothetical protein